VTAGSLDILASARGQGHTVSASAEMAGMSVRSAFRHLQRPEVAERVESEREAVRQTLGQWLDRIVMVGDLAVERLVDLLTDPDTPAHVSARVAVAVMCERRALADVVEMDERLARLETISAGVDPTDPDGRERLRRLAADGPAA